MNKSIVALTLSDIVCLSEKRRAVLLLLGKKGYSIDELTEKMNMTAHSLAPQLKTLRDEEIVVLKDGIYELTNIGQVLVKNMYPLFETIDVLEKDLRFWFSRNLSVIPPDLMERIRDIGNYRLLEYDISEYMYDVPAEFSDNFKKSKHSLCLLSVYHPIYTEMQFEMAESGKDMTIIVTPKVYDRLVEDHEKRLKELIKRENVTLMKWNDKGDAIGPSMTITDVFTYIYFFNNDGVYDYKIIVSLEDATRAWAKELYKYYKKQSTVIEE